MRGTPPPPNKKTTPLSYVSVVGCRNGEDLLVGGWTNPIEKYII